MIRISAVNYLNAKPFIHGLTNSGYMPDFKLNLDIPSACAKKLLEGKADIGLIPIAAIPHLPNHKIISNYCIGAEGAVNSVLLLSQVPLQNIEKVILDYQSNTSVLLVKILSFNLWNINPLWVQGKPGFENKITNNTAGVVIGDRALELKAKFPYSYDLSEAWKTLTGLPFVFACWITNTDLPNSFLDAFNKALKWGLDHKGDIKTEFVPLSNIADYLDNFISYDLNDKKKEAMNLFFELGNQLNNYR